MDLSQKYIMCINCIFVKVRYLLFMILLMSSSLHVRGVANSWGYQLQNYDIDVLKAFNAQLIVMDYSMNGSDASAFSASEIRDIQSTGKTLVSYISIGEAEDYRYYFDQTWLTNPPSWLDSENPNWEGNYKVKYWDPEWQSIVYNYIDKIISAAFNGIYLDIVDGYEFYQDSVPDASELMVDFVSNISEYAKNKAGSEFLIIPQNGEGLLSSSSYRSVIDAIGKEDLYLEDDGKTKKTAEKDYSESMLDLLIADSKPVYLVEYTSDTASINYVKEQASLKGYTLYIGTRDLDRLVNQSFTTSESSSLLLIPSLIALVIVRKIFSHKSN